MTAILCNRCKRPNSVSAKICIWCREALQQHDAPWQADSVIVEADYLEGIDRFADPCPVRLMVSGDGIQVVELVPGSRSVRIPAGSIIETRISRSDRTEGSARLSRWRVALEPLGFGSAKSAGAADQQSYILEVRYTTGGEVSTGLFCWSERIERAQTPRLEQILAGIRDSKDSSESTVDTQ